MRLFKRSLFMFWQNIKLSNYSSYKIGGPARYFFKAKTYGDLDKILSRKDDFSSIFILGGGTNILFDDGGFDGLVLMPCLNFIKRNGNEIKAGSGVLVSELLDFATEKGLSGLEWAGGLPGMLGGAIRGNAGAFGGEIKDVVKEVVSLNFENKPLVVKRSNAECGFGYRDSVFKKNDKEIIVEATFCLKPGDKTAIRNSIEEKIKYRSERHPMEYPNVGSIFKNVPVASAKQNGGVIRPDFPIKNDPFPVIPTAYLIAESRLKGVSCGGAMISPKHPNFIVNALNASSADVRTLISLIKEKVFEKFLINLEEEVKIL